MFDANTVKNAMGDLVGFRYSTHPYYKYQSDVVRRITSDFGYWVNSLQGADFYTIEATLPSTIKGIDIVKNERYVIRTAGGVFTNVGAADNEVGTAFTATGTEPTSWGDAVLELQSCLTYLDMIYGDVMVDLVSKFINNSKAYLKQSSLLSNQAVTTGVADRNNPITKSGRFVGFVLEPHEGNNIVNIIKRLSFLGNTANPITDPFYIYLYETSQNSYQHRFLFQYVSADSLQWQTLDEDKSEEMYIKYDGVTGFTGGIGQKFIIGYYEDNLTGEAFGMDFNKSLKNYSVFGKYMSVYPIAIPSSDFNTESEHLPSDVTNLEQYRTTETHGLGFKFTANCDYTNMIVDNMHMFAEPMMYAMALRILEDAVASVGDGVHNSTKDAAVAEWRKLIAKYSGVLYGGYMSISSEQSVYRKGLIELLTMDFSGIDCVCMKKDFRHEYGIGNLM